MGGINTFTNRLYTSTFVKTVSNPIGPKQSHFGSRLENVRKDVERAFSAFQTHFTIIRYYSLSWLLDQIWKIINVYVIMNEMSVESELFDRSTVWYQAPLAEPHQHAPTEFSEVLVTHHQIRD